MERRGLRESRRLARICRPREVVREELQPDGAAPDKDADGRNDACDGHVHEYGPPGAGVCRVSPRRTHQRRHDRERGHA